MLGEFLPTGIHNEYQNKDSQDYLQNRECFHKFRDLKILHTTATERKPNNKLEIKKERILEISGDVSKHITNYP